MLWWMGKKTAVLHEALACTLPKKSLPTLMTPHVSQYFLTSCKDNASGSPQGSFSAFCASTVSLVFCSICPTRTGGLKIRATHPASCAAPYVSKGCASWQNRTERTLLAVGGQRSWENWGGSQGSRGKKKVPNVGGNLGRNERGVVEQSTRWLQPHRACNMLHWESVGVFIRPAADLHAQRM